MIGFFLSFVMNVLPEIAMTAELSLMPPVTNGGVVVWVDRAFGKVAAALVALNMVVYQLADLATFPTLLADYMRPVDADWGNGLAMGGAYGVVVLGLVVNSWNMELATSVYMLMLALIMAPFAAGLALSVDGWPYAVSASMGVAPAVEGASRHWGDLSLFMSTLLWLNTGWDSMGNLAGEVAKPRSLVVGLASAALACPAVYVLCTFGALAAGPGTWDDGYLAEAYGRFWRPLSPAIVAMGGASNFLLYSTELGCVARLMQAMADPDLGLRLLPSCLAGRLPGTGAPWAALVAITCFELVLVSGLKFDYLVQVSTLLHVFVWWFSIAAFARLRLDAGQGFERLRLWEVPWGRLGALAVVCLRAPVLVFFLVCASSVPSVVLGACAGNVGFVVLVIAWARCIQGLSVSSLSSEALRQAAATE